MSSAASKVKRFRTKFSDEQLSTLKDFYRHDNHPRRTELEDLAARLGLDYSVVKQWFDNKRHRDRPSSSSSQTHTPNHHASSGRGLSRSSSQNGRELSSPRAPPFPVVFHGRHSGSKGDAAVSPGSFKDEDELDGPAAKRDLQPCQLEMIPVSDSSVASSDADGSPVAAHASGSSAMGSCVDLPVMVTELSYAANTTLSSIGGNQYKRVPIDKGAGKSEGGKRMPHLQQPTYFQRLDSEPMEYYEETNEVLHPMPRNTSYDKKDFISTLMPQFLSLIDRRKTAHGEVDYPGFAVEAQRLLHGLAYVSETRVEQGDNIERNNTFKVGSITFPARPPVSHDIQTEAIAKARNVEICYLHESKEEGTVETTGRQVATQRLVVCHFDDRQSLVCEVGVKARGTSLSLDPICQCQSDVFPQHPNRIHNLGDTSTSYRAWGDIDKLRSLIDTAMNTRELLSFIVFIISPLLHGAHWTNICMRSFFPAGTPHYYDVVEGLT